MPLSFLLPVPNPGPGPGGLVQLVRPDPAHFCVPLLVLALGPSPEPSFPLLGPLLGSLVAIIELVLSLIFLIRLVAQSPLLFLLLLLLPPAHVPAPSAPSCWLWRVHVRPCMVLVMGLTLAWSCPGLAFLSWPG